MKNCKLIITTTIDNQSTEIVRKTQASLSPFLTKIVYSEENAQVNITLENGVLHIERTGDYTQSLHFKDGEILEGRLGICGADGVIHTHTRKLSFSVTDTSLLLSLHYVLLVGDEPQDVKIRMFLKATE